MSVSNRTAKTVLVTTVPNQSQEKLPSRPTRPDNIDAPVIENHFTSAACLGRARAFRFCRVAFDKSFSEAIIIYGIDVPTESSEHGALQLDGVEVQSLYREETGSLEAEAARG